jgi:hypothetical protein
MLDHEMDVERKLRLFSDGGDHGGTERNVIDEVAVHDIEMEPICAGLFSAMDLVFEAREIRGEDGRSYQCFHAEETLLRKAATGKLSNAVLFRYLFLFSQEEEAEDDVGKSGGRSGPAAFP